MSNFIFRSIAKVHVWFTKAISSDPSKVKRKSKVSLYQQWKQSHNDEQLIFAANAGHVIPVIKLVRKDKKGNRKANPNVVSDSGMTPLLHAIDQGHVAVIKALLEHGASPFEQPVNIPIWDDNQDRVTKDPMDRGILRGLDEAGILEIAGRRFEGPDYFENKLQPMIKVGTYRNNPAGGALVTLMLRHWDELSDLLQSITVSVEVVEESTAKDSHEQSLWSEESIADSVS